MIFRNSIFIFYFFTLYSSAPPYTLHNILFYFFLLFVIRFMSAYEQKVETPDKNFQYILFACEPYETIAFKIPNQPIDKKDGRFYTNWDVKNRKFVLTLYFLDSALLR